MSVDVSVVIAAKDEAEYVAEAVTSVASQAGLNVELVFVDDNSDDNTHEIVASLAQAMPNIRLVRNPKRGKCSAFNYGVSLATGKYLAIFAGDDIMPEGSLAERWQSIKDVKSDRPVVGLSRLITFSDDKRYDGFLVPKNPKKGGFTGVSYLMDRRAAALMFPVPESLPNEDTWLEIATRHLDMQMVHSGVIGCKWRVHSGNSIKVDESFEAFNRKITPRRAAYGMFLEQHGAAMSAANRRQLQAKVRCEEARKAGNLWGILASDVPVLDKLRNASHALPSLYAVRTRFYALLSGL